jgi:hypothetical protein
MRNNGTLKALIDMMWAVETMKMCMLFSAGLLGNDTE